MSDHVPLPDRLRDYVNSRQWKFAKTYAQTWPHEYIVRDRVDCDNFTKLVQHIRAHGRPAPFYQKTYIYFSEAGKLYWTMGDPVEETTIVNRCREEDSYEQRLKDGRLPKSSRSDSEQE
ncbi:MAG: hypothetical protein HZA89_00240 [Verrucomicrobia bacterium]|nr:hypothetical protein [Verrucomicrobiota bacterium]